MSKVLSAFRKKRSDIRRVIAKYRNNPADIDEIEQDVFLTCFSLELKEPVRYPEHLLLRVARNLALNEAVKKSNTSTESLPENPGSPVYKDEARPSAEDEYAARQHLGVLAEALASLSEQDRRIFVMRRVEGLKSSQIATRLNVSVRTVERRAGAALLTCYRFMQERGIDMAESGLGKALSPRAATGSDKDAKRRGETR